MTNPTRQQDETARTRFPAERPVKDLICRLIPGETDATEKLRSDLLEVIGNLFVRSIFLSGPIGVGKSSIARIIAFGKRVAPLRESKAEKLIENLRFEGPGLIDAKLMSWYVELTITGLMDTLAQSQLFGVAERAVTDVKGKPGVFESASTGRGGDLRDGAGVTGGVVFLDEIADLSMEMQAKLLPVLSGGKFYRVGGEGSAKYELTFKGVAIAASWREPVDQFVRPDLMSRLSANIITIPSTEERKEDLRYLMEAIQNQVVDRYNEVVNHILKTDPSIDRGFYSKFSKKSTTLSERDYDGLIAADWSKRGELRGITYAIEQILLGGQSVEKVIRDLPFCETEDFHSEKELDVILEWLRIREPEGSGLAAHLRKFELERRVKLKKVLLENPELRNLIAEKLQIDSERFLRQVRQLGRDRGSEE
ncbi:sigma 54-interacting transcriptional regulator [Acidobacteriota bacterium]